MGSVGLGFFGGFSRSEADGHRQGGELHQALESTGRRLFFDVHISHLEVLLRSDVHQELDKVEVLRV